MNKLILATACLGLGFAASTHAQTNVIFWGGNDVVTSGANLTNPGFDPETTISPSSNYIAPAFSGGYVHTGNATGNTWTIFANNALGGASNKDWIQLSYSTATTSANVHQALVFFSQDAFAGHTVDTTYSLTNATSLEYRARRTGGLTAETQHRLVAQIGANYYITDSLGTQGGTAGGDLVTLADPTAANWYAFTPETSVASASIGAAANIVSGGTISGITGLGLWFNNSRGTTSGTLNMNITDISFNAVATAIPEPSTFAALAGLGVLGLAASRRRRA